MYGDANMDPGERVGAFRVLVLDGRASIGCMWGYQFGTRWGDGHRIEAVCPLLDACNTADMDLSWAPIAWRPRAW